MGWTNTFTAQVWTTFRDQIWWKSAVAKFPKVRVVYQTKKLGLRGTRPSPHFRQNGPIAPKIPWTLSPLDLSTYTEFGPDRLRFAGLIPKILIFRPKKSIQYRISAYKYIYSTIKTEVTQALGRQGAKPSKIKAWYSRLTCKNCSYLCAPL